MLHFLKKNIIHDFFLMTFYSLPEDIIQHIEERHSWEQHGGADESIESCDDNIATLH